MSLTVVCTAGLWPFAHPSAAVAEAEKDPELRDTEADFADRDLALTSAYDYRELHELIDRLEPEQAEELRRHALRAHTADPIAAAGGWVRTDRGQDGGS